ncbi:hypothetical protein GCM10010218_26740 [Streptomyces mashuensis]|uniref:Helix-turn-helix domain-containing protein n=1 Tax=Streptomyces mashuensis TaxID=33904 RepID=A0A919EBT1_9ACTN|nr:hypothetical protein [Streptomyces mashuensis]GHF44073.1 hypothetical protein GCM10010218_26740 [Streptomyces mashuensis]
MARHAVAAIDFHAAHDGAARDRFVAGGRTVDDRVAGEPLPAVFEGLSVPVRTAASMLGLTPWTVAHLIERGELRSERGGQYRYVTLTSIFSYRRMTR